MKVRLLFEAKLAVYITERQWHPSQEFHVRRDGRVVMAFGFPGRGWPAMTDTDDARKGKPAWPLDTITYA